MVNMADPAYLRTMRIPLVAGRALSDEDRAAGPKVAVSNEECPCVVEGPPFRSRPAH